MSWSPVAKELERRGRTALVPSLLGIADAPEPEWLHALSAVRAATVGIPSPVMLIGHSAAGPLLPAIADAVRTEVAGLIFVDSLLPPTHGSASLAGERFMDKLRALTGDGLLPRSSWFRQQVTSSLIPPDSPAAALLTETPALPLSYFTGTVPMPQGWSERPCAYLLLGGEARGDSAAQARARGWPVAAPRGTHQLSIVTNPVGLVDSLLHLTGNLIPSP